MNVATYATRNLFRRKGRTLLTISAVAIAVLIFGVIRTVVAMWGVGADAAAKDRLGTRHKASITMQLPKRYIDEIRAVPGVKAATWAIWFGAKDPKQRTEFFAGMGVDHESWFEVMDDMGVDPAVLTEWKATRNGAILGEVLARKLQVKPGDKLVITSDIYPGDWEFKVIGTYRALRKTVDRTSLVFRWDYLNDNLPPAFANAKDQIGWVVSRIDAPGASATVARAIDQTFAERDDQTLTMSERALALSFMGMFSAVLQAFDYVSLAILMIMALILANTVAMSVRERTHEYGVLRAVGFRPGHIIGFVLGESVLIAAIGGVIGVGLTVLVVNVLFGPIIEENMAGFFPYMRAPAGVLVLALAVAAALGALAATVPALRAARLKVVDALRRVD